MLNISSPPSFKVTHTVFSDVSSWLASSGKFDRNQWKISWKMLSQNSAWNKQYILPSQKFYTLWTALTGNCIKAESPGSKTFWDLLFNFLSSYFYFIANVSKNRSGLDFQKETITLKDLLIWLEHTVDLNGSESCTDWYGKHLIVCRVLYMSGGVGFLPSTASPSMPQVKGPWAIDSVGGFGVDF